MWRRHIMNKKYKVVLDCVNSYLEEDKNGYSFEEACDVILNYVTDARYLFQVKRWERYKKEGEENCKWIL